ncbi:MAG: cobalt ECF transporter T component CbiQ [Mobilitalea sp.]
MSKISDAMYEIVEMDELAEKKTLIHQLHPLIKLIISILYITLVVSYDKYDIIGLLPMLLYPAIVFYLSDLSIKTALKKMKYVLPVICFIGIFNPFFDHRALININGIIITGGIVSMITLILKGIYALLAAFLLMATTGIERICYAFRLLHVPSILVTQILLVYRYIMVLMKEANAIMEAYSMRAPKEKGIRYRVWGSLLGQLLLRSLNRAENLYDSMLLRGFKGEYYYGKEQELDRYDYGYLFLWLLILVGLRFLYIFLY